MVGIITLKQQKFSQSDPVLIRQFYKKIAVRSSPDPAKIGFSLDPILIRAHLCKFAFPICEHSVGRD